MKTGIIKIVYSVLGFIGGVIFTAIVLNISVGNMMVKEFKSPYDFDKTVDVMIKRINEKNGWHVTNVIDQNHEVTVNGGFPIGNFKIVKYCHGGYSAKVLKPDENKKFGNMMPKSFAIYEKSDGSIYVSTMNGAIMGKMFGGEFEKIIEEVSVEVESMMRFINLKYTLY